MWLKIDGYFNHHQTQHNTMAIDTKPIIARISQSQINEMIETYDDMDYEDFDTFCDY